jgi:hypothetical protein
VAAGHFGPGPVVHHNPYVAGGHFGHERHHRLYGGPYYSDYGSCWPYNPYDYDLYPYNYCY